MRKSVIYKVLTGVVLVGALAFGGTALAATGGTDAVTAGGTTFQAPAGAAGAASTVQSTEVQTAVDNDNVEFESESQADDATEVSAPEASETAGGAEAAESATEADGPGGHADEPGNANADHQFDGEE